MVACPCFRGRVLWRQSCADYAFARRTTYQRTNSGSGDPAYVRTCQRTRRDSHSLTRLRVFTVENSATVVPLRSGDVGVCGRSANRPRALPSRTRPWLLFLLHWSHAEKQSHKSREDAQTVKKVVQEERDRPGN